MILYQALSSYQILECMIHRQVFYQDKKAVLILGSYITERMPWYRELETRGFFDHVFLFRFGGYRGSEKEILRQVEEEYERTIPWKPEEFEKLLIAGIHTYLQVWFISREIPFEMFEDGSGALSRPRILADIHRKSSPARYEIIQKYRLYDHDSPWITRKYYDEKAQVPGFTDEKAQDFQVLESFLELPQKVQENIRSLFRLPSLEEGEEEVLVLTQQFANLGQLSLEEQKKIYQHLFDYYLQGKTVLIKPHPDDIFCYSRLFPRARLLREPFPSELLPFVFRKLPRTLCTISSTGVNQIQGEFQDTLIFNSLYETSFIQDSSYYGALVLAEYLGTDSIWCRGVNQVQLENLAKIHWTRKNPLLITQNREELQGKVLAVEDDYEAEISGEKKESFPFSPVSEELPEKPENLLGILYLNSRKQYRMYAHPQEKEGFRNMLPLCIREEDRIQTIYFEPRKEEVRIMAETFIKSPSKKEDGAPVSIEALTDSQIQLRMLEGILAATEKRLLEYIEEEKVLRKELEAVRGEGEKH